MDSTNNSGPLWEKGQQIAGDERAHPAVALLRLRRLLGQAREAAGLTLGEVAATIGCSMSKVVRTEAGQVRPSIPDVRALLNAYGAPGQLAAAEQLTQAANARQWTYPFRDVLTAGERSCWELEPSAAVVGTVALVLLPDLLQTEQYAQAAARALRPSAPAELVARRVEATVRRQQQLLLLLDDPDPPLLWFYVDESALHRCADSAVRHRQLDHLLKLATHPRIRIRVMPLRAGICTKASFTMLFLDLILPRRTPPDPPENLLFVDAPHGLVRKEDPAEVGRHLGILAWCDRHALLADALDQAVDDARRGVLRQTADGGIRWDE